MTCDVKGNRTRRALPLSLAAQIATMLPCFLLGSLFPLIRQDLGLAEGALGTIVATYFATSAIGSGGLARYCDEYGPWIVARFALIATAILSAALPFSTGFWSLASVMAAAGLANGIVQPATNVALSTSVAATRQGLAFGLKQASIPLAALFAGLAVPIVALPAGWRAAYWIAAMLPLGLTLLLPRRSGTPRGRTSRPAGVDAGWSGRTLVLLGIVSGLGAGSANAMAAFFVTSAAQQGLSISAAGILMAFGSGTSIAVRITLGALADRIALPLLGVVSTLLGGGALAYALFATGGGMAQVGVATVLGFGMGWGWAGLTNLAIVRGNRRGPGRASGVVQSGLFLGAVAGPLGFGWITAHFGLTMAWWSLAIFGALACTLALHTARIVGPQVAQAG